MKYEELLLVVGKEAVFRSSLLAAVSPNPVDLGRQLSRWRKSGRLIQLRRGVYALSERYRKNDPHPFTAANLMKSASYVSLQSALEYHGLIPEYVPSVTSVTTGRPEHLANSLGSFIYKHVRRTLFFGYRRLDLEQGQRAFVAEPEKALLDLLYLPPGSGDPAYLRELRLQNLASLNMGRLKDMAAQTKSPKLMAAYLSIHKLREEDRT
ncbi:MAG: type IV toxin-antitoxin system AbiEi family antitoxin domain-containing protein [Candidatus Aminicenantes bacterium]|nr:type IV toxin-antitoxin system AbiEi family antitoxin domain-containing protein [Candidatus Aminicenantes bacterium]